MQEEHDAGSVLIRHDGGTCVVSVPAGQRVTLDLTGPEPRGRRFKFAAWLLAIGISGAIAYGVSRVIPGPAAVAALPAFLPPLPDAAPRLAAPAPPPRAETPAADPFGLRQ